MMYTSAAICLFLLLETNYKYKMMFFVFFVENPFGPNIVDMHICMLRNNVTGPHKFGLKVC